MSDGQMRTQRRRLATSRAGLPLLAVVLLPAAAAAAASAGRGRGASVMSGVKLLYNNDGENLWAVDSSGASVPYHPHTGYAIDTATT